MANVDSSESLCAEVLKAKYFPDTSILEVVLVSNISYTWRSILKGGELLKEGPIWRIGAFCGSKFLFYGQYCVVVFSKISHYI
jgi:hypothetical protein